LKNLGVTAFAGVAKAADETRRRIAASNEKFALLNKNGDGQ
jgi:hypothetical protein